MSIQNFHFCRAPWRMGLSPILISRFVSRAHHMSIQNFHFCCAPWRMGSCPFSLAGSYRGRTISLYKIFIFAVRPGEWASRPFSLAGSHHRNENTVLLAAKTHPLSAQLGLAGTLLHIYAAADRDMPRQATMPAGRSVLCRKKQKKRPRRIFRRGRFFTLFRIPLYAIRPWGRPQPAPCLPRCPRT